jgi:cytochrome c-type biogenesis protein CcmE
LKPFNGKFSYKQDRKLGMRGFSMERNTTKKILIFIFAGFIYLQFTAFAIADMDYTDYAQIPIGGLVSNPGHYDGKKVTVEGEVEKVHYTTSSGNPYTLFKLYDSDHNEVGVYYKGNLPISKGNKVRVIGKFSKEKRAALFLKFKNIIKANQVEKI